MINDQPRCQRSAWLIAYVQATDARVVAKGAIPREDFAEAMAQEVAELCAAAPSLTTPMAYTALAEQNWFSWLDHGTQVAPSRPRSVAKAAPAAPDPNTTIGRIEIAASAIVRAEPSLTHEQAVTKALEMNPDFYDALMSEIQV